MSVVTQGHRQDREPASALTRVHPLPTQLPPPRPASADEKGSERGPRGQRRVLEGWGWLWKMKRDSRKDSCSKGWAEPEGHVEMGQSLFPNLCCA